MKCDICGIRDAILFVQKTSKSSTVELHLCAECAHERSLTGKDDKSKNKNEKEDEIEFSLTDLLTNLLTAETTLSDQKHICSGCNQSLADLKKYKTIGCSECYTFFRSDILSLLRKNGVNASYCGSLPKKLAHFRSRLTDRTLLQTKLQQAVENEDYESAALYRDRLKAFDSILLSFEDSVHG